MDNKKWTDEDLESAFRNSSKLETFEDLKDFLLKRRHYADAIESNCTIDIVMPRFSKEDIELNKDAIEKAIAILDWDNYNKELYDSPKDQVTDLYWLIDKLNGA